eukprot:1220188-Pyramimonas_sp.AAC.1
MAGCGVLGSMRAVRRPLTGARLRSGNCVDRALLLGFPFLNRSKACFGSYVIPPAWRHLSNFTCR